MSACNCMGCPHPVNCRCRCPECHILAGAAFDSFTLLKMISYTITIPGAPLTMNARVHWAVRNRANKDWYAIVSAHTIGRNIPRPAFSSAILEIELHYKVRQRGARKHDCDNIAKVTQDALVRCGILTDDSYPHLHETRLRARPGPVDEVVLVIREAE